MDKILHQLISSLSHYWHGFKYRRWCRISSINSIIDIMSHILRVFPRYFIFNVPLHFFVSSFSWYDSVRIADHIAPIFKFLKFLMSFRGSLSLNYHLWGFGDMSKFRLFVWVWVWDNITQKMQNYVYMKNNVKTRWQTSRKPKKTV